MYFRGGRWWFFDGPEEIIAVNGSIPMNNWTDIENIAKTPSCSMYIFMMTGVMCTVYTSFGLVGNIMGLVALSHVRIIASTAFLLRCIAAVDIFYLCSYFIAASIPEIIYYYVGPETVRYFVYFHWGIYPLAAMSQSVSMWLMVVITVYRYMYVFQKSKHPRIFQLTYLRICVAFIIVASILTELPKYWESRPQLRVKDDHQYVVVEEQPIWHNANYQLWYRMIFMVVIGRMLPIAIVIGATYLMVRFMTKRQRLRSNSLDKRAKRDRQDPISKVLISLAVIFVICQTPMAVYPVIRYFHPNYNSKPCNVYHSLLIFADSLAALNAAVNFYVFYPFVPMFRQALYAMVCFCRANKTEDSERKHRVSVGSQSSTCSTESIQYI